MTKQHIISRRKGTKSTEIYHKKPKHNKWTSIKRPKIFKYLEKWQNKHCRTNTTWLDRTIINNSTRERIDMKNGRFNQPEIQRD